MKEYRYHGFEWPLNVYQVCITLDVFCSTVLCSSSHIQAFEFKQAVTYCVFYYTSLLLLAVFWVKASLSNPTDPVVLENRSAILSNREFDSSRYESICTICNTSVGTKSKHCGKCNRCVEGFDHHCIWLNNCIGKRNHKLFMMLICLFFVHEAIIIVAASLVINSGRRQDSEGYWRSRVGVQIFLIVQAAAIDLFLLNLIVLHAWLWRKGLTTYELIKRRQKRNKVLSEIALSKASQISIENAAIN